MAARKKKASLEDKIDALSTIVEKGFAGVAGDVADIKDRMATKEQFAGLQEQVNSIERHLRETRIEVRLSDLEEKVFGDARR